MFKKMHNDSDINFVKDPLNEMGRVAGMRVLTPTPHHLMGNDYLSINSVRTNGPTLCPIIWLPYAPEYVKKTF